MGTSTERNARRKKRRQSQKDREQDEKKVLEGIILENKSNSTTRV